MCQYCTICATTDAPEFNHQKLYNIEAVDSSKTKIFAALTPRKDKVDALVQLLNKFEVSLIHMEDILDDFTGTEYLSQFFPDLL
ncbi:hypothetical protein H8711_00745 [Clostridiaceae bacterium NSJ-31]|uniref:Uncharacterized protein n=1 Tax=Ligaoa zhengdingensis TaxID=2763658 RepID=A0A926I3L2_9FIRM|nr:hypothetical protein [Ligaoa zhengdingensis]